MVAQDGHFYVEGKRIKLWSINVTAGNCFVPHQEAKQLALRLSQAGINCVRLHHMDYTTFGDGHPGWGTGIWDDNNPLKLSPKALERLDYFIDQLARHGIYCDLNLHVSRVHSKYLNLPEIPNNEFDKMVDLFTPQLIEAQKDYARQLLGHVNQYRHVRYGNDSAVAIIEINNEDSLFMWSAPTILPILPAPYSRILQSQYVSWLKNRYGSTDGLRKVWAVGSSALGENVLTNSEFKGPAGGTSPGWFLGYQGDSAAHAVAAPAGTARIEITKSDPTIWHVQLIQPSLSLKAGAYYTVTFQARADQNRNIDFTVNQNHEPWSSLGLSSAVKLTPQWTSVRAGFFVSQDDDNARVCFDLGGSSVPVELKDVQLRPGGCEGLHAEESIEQGNIPVFGQSQTDIRSTDALTFLADTDKRFWDSMYGYIKKDLGATALVTGTIVFGPLGLYGQSDMDFIDAHAYWQHPQFPGRPWDENNWRILQKAMVDSPGEATLFNLACSRLAGKPFTVTEYSHPAPNDYRAECVPEMAAFAAAQDWDGMWFFENGNVPASNYITGFFDIGSDPAKFGFLSAGAAIFRGGGIEPMPQSYVLHIGGQSKDPMPSLSRQQMRHALNTTADIDDVTHLDWSHLLDHRVYLSRTPGEIEDNRVMEQHGEIIWQGGEGKGNFLAAGRGAMVWIGRSNLPNDKLPLVQLLSPNFAAIEIAAMDGKPFDQTDKILVTACGRGENKDMQFSANRETVGTHWGVAPAMIQPVEASIRFPMQLAAGSWSITPLNADGAPKAQAQAFTPASGLKLSASGGTMWYLLTRQ